MEYVKDNKKNIAKGIRFNGVQLNIALGKAKKKSAQQLIDFLIDRFVNGENPVLDRQPDYSNNIKDAAKWTTQIVVPTPEPIYPPQPLDKEGLYYQAISEAETQNDFKGIYKAIEAEKMPFPIKSRLYEALTKAKTQKGFVYNDIRDE